MDERTPRSDSGAEEPASSEGTPRWVKAFAVVGLVFFVLLVLLLATGGHGPGRHSLAPPAVGHVQS